MPDLGPDAVIRLFLMITGYAHVLEVRILVNSLRLRFRKVDNAPLLFMSQL